MHPQTRVFLLASLISAGLVGHAQPSQTTFPAPPPTTKAAVGQWDAAIVHRAAAILESPAQWNRTDTDKCPADAHTFSISCALEAAVDEAAGLRPDPRHGWSQPTSGAR
jgi:hypothetical protein